MGTYRAARGAVEAIGGSTDWDERCPDGQGGNKGISTRDSRPETTAPGAGPGWSG